MNNAPLSAPQLLAELQAQWHNCTWHIKSDDYIGLSAEGEGSGYEVLIIISRLKHEKAYGSVEGAVFWQEGGGHSRSSAFEYS